MKYKMAFIKLILLISLFLLILGLVNANSINDIGFDNLKKEVIKYVDMNKMKQADNKMFKRFYNMEYSDLKNCVLYISNENMDVEEILLIETVSKEQIDIIENNIQKRIDTQLENFNSYGINQTKLIKNNIIEIDNQYILFVISDYADEIQNTFHKSLH